MPPKAAPKPKPAPLRVHSTAHISDNITFTGTHPITIGSNAFLHPRSRFNSALGPINISANTLIAERCAIAATSLDGVFIGEWSVLETGVRVEGGKIGNDCEIGVACLIEGEVRDGVRVGAMERVRRGEKAEGEVDREEMVGRRMVTQRHLEVVRGLVANAKHKYA